MLPAGRAGLQLVWPTVDEVRSLGAVSRWPARGHFWALLAQPAEPPPAADSPATCQGCCLCSLGPSRQVQNSLEGWAAGSSIPGPAKNVQKPFLQPYYHRQDWGTRAKLAWGRGTRDWYQKHHAPRHLFCILGLVPCAVRLIVRVPSRLWVAHRRHQGGSLCVRMFTLPATSRAGGEARSAAGSVPCRT